MMDGAAMDIAADILHRVGIPLDRLPAIRVRDVKRGRWSDKTNIITLPAWLWDNRPDSYRDWYIGHELAHYLVGRPGHGLRFQLMLAWLCPDTWHWETTYKPREYTKAWEFIQNGMSSSMGSFNNASQHAQASRACQPCH